MNQILVQKVATNKNVALVNTKKKTNQIAPSPSFKVEFSDEIIDIPYDIPPKVSSSYFKKLKQFVKKNQYQLQFIISVLIATIFLAILFFQIWQNHRMEKISQELLENYNITTLYGTHENLDILKAANEQTFSNPFVIGIIKIDKINLNYPILSESNRDLLKISLCRFAGPMPNEIGNLCIAGHNLVDNKFFSFLYKLEPGDNISIFDLSGMKVIYTVYDKYEVSPDDLSCTSQDVGENRILTLLTCNNVNGKRTVVKSKENR